MEKIKFPFRTGHEGPGGSSFSLTSALGRGWATAAFTPRPTGKNTVPIAQGGEWAPGTVWTGAENIAPTGIRSLDRQARGESLYRLRYSDRSKSICLAGRTSVKLLICI
jgi:hypothetical protein